MKILLFIKTDSYSGSPYSTERIRYKKPKTTDNIDGKEYYIPFKKSNYNNVEAIWYPKGKQCCYFEKNLLTQRTTLLAATARDEF